MQEATMLYKLRRSLSIIHFLGWCNETIVLQKLYRIHHQYNKDPIERSLQKSLDLVKGVKQLYVINFTDRDIKWA